MRCWPRVLVMEHGQILKDLFKHLRSGTGKTFETCAAKIWQLAKINPVE